MVTGHVSLPPNVYDPILQGLQGRRRASTGAPPTPPSRGSTCTRFPLAGKTGTAQVNGKGDTSLFASFGPIGRPQYTIVAVLEESGFGADAAAPVVRHVWETVTGQHPTHVTDQSDRDHRLMALSTGRSAGAFGGRDRSRRDLSAPWRHIDPVLLVCTVFVSLLGIVTVYSATIHGLNHDPTGPPDHQFLFKQTLFVALGVRGHARGGQHRLPQVPRLGGPHLRGDDPAARRWSCRRSAPTPTAPSRGTRSAGFQLQPSEISKVALIVSLGVLLAAWKGEIDLRRLAVALVVAGLPMGLIMLQPDLGTALVFIAITAAMLCRRRRAGPLPGRAGAGRRHRRGRHPQVEHAGPVPEGPADRVRRPDQQHPGRLQRQPEPDRHRQRSHHRRTGCSGEPRPASATCPSSRPTSSSPRSASSSAWSGGSLLLGLFSIIVWRIWRTARLARDSFGTLLCVGVLAMLVFQIFESMGMTMGIMPVTGIPLPFMSYGGSSTVACFVGIGLVLNVHMHRFR